MPANGRANCLATWGLPAPFPDELGTSLIARYLCNWGYVDRSGLLRQVLGSARRVLQGACPPACATIGLSLGLRGPEPGMQFLQRHTLVPYLLSSTPAATAAQLAHRLCGVGGRALQYDLRLRAMGPVFDSRLRFCKICAAWERYHYGVPYWHRLHQVVGLAHCSTHGCPLHSSNVPFVAYSPDQITAASTAIRPGSEYPSVDSVFDRELETQLAGQVIAALRDPEWGTTLARPQIRRALLEIGYRAKGDRVAASRVTADLDAFLRSHACSLDRLGTSDWPLRLFTNIPSVATPLQQQIFVLFLRAGMRSK